MAPRRRKPEPSTEPAPVTPRKTAAKKRKKTSAFASAADIKVGVIGYGGAFNMGRSHLNEMQRAGMTPCAVCEIDPDRLAVARADFPGIETYGSTAEMLRKSEVNLLAIITPHNTHAKLAVQCLTAGRHVVCEKPLAITTRECDTMIAAAKTAGVVLSTYHNRHWDGHMLEALEHIRAGAIGEVFRIECHMGSYGKPGDWWRSSKSISGGILYDWGVHLLEYALQVMPGKLTEVSGFAKKGFWGPQTAWKDDANEDEGFLVARFSNGGRVSLQISQLEARGKDGLVEFVGTGGSYLMCGDRYELTTFEEGRKVVRHGRNRKGEGWKLYQNVADHLTRGTPLVITPEWARRPIHIIDLGVRSARLGRALPAVYG